jgi:ATP-dependent helicase HrpA
MQVDAPSLQSLSERIEQTMFSERHVLRRRLRGLAARHARPEMLQAVSAEVDRALRRAQERRARAPRPSYPPELPVAQQKDEIARLIAGNQVVVVCGETGSGKTTQLPKICLELGRGALGMIGHTQPRRIAARTVAARIAQELNVALRNEVGYKIRFGDETTRDTYIKLMTDGILLAETQHDRLLEQYDTIIIDEAHERSLNIDFLLGYLKQLLPATRLCFFRANVRSATRPMR